MQRNALPGLVIMATPNAFINEGRLTPPSPNELGSYNETVPHLL